jgi:hypothetical protein
MNRMVKSFHGASWSPRRLVSVPQAIGLLGLSTMARDPGFERQGCLKGHRI